MRKLPLVFIEKKTWESWISVFNVWERGKFIGEDGKDPKIIPRLPRFHITKIDVAPTLDLRDSTSSSWLRKFSKRRFALRTMSPAGIT
jgi:hypothetical protein